MTLQRAHELISTQRRFGGGCNRNAVRLIPGEVQRVHGQAAVGGLSRELDPGRTYGLEPGTGAAGVGH
jgi:hypothetical protein